MPILAPHILPMGRADLSKKTAKLAGAELFGLSSCSVKWGELLAKHLIVDTLTCTGGQYLNQSELDCLTGKLLGDINANCC